MDIAKFECNSHQTSGKLLGHKVSRDHEDEGDNVAEEIRILVRDVARYVKMAQRNRNANPEKREMLYYQETAAKINYRLDMFLHARPSVRGLDVFLQRVATLAYLDHMQIRMHRSKYYLLTDIEGLILRSDPARNFEEAQKAKGIQYEMIHRTREKGAKVETQGTAYQTSRMMRVYRGILANPRNDQLVRHVVERKPMKLIYLMSDMEHDRSDE